MVSGVMRLRIRELDIMYILTMIAVVGLQQETPETARNPHGATRQRSRLAVIWSR